MGWLSWLTGATATRAAERLSPEQREALEAWQRVPEPDLRYSHRQCRYVVVDVESSGLDTRKDRLISIGAVSVERGMIDLASAFQVVLRQDRASTTENILLHGIGASAQMEGAEPVEALLSFLDYIGKAPLVAYHAFFDRAMIDKTMRTYLGAALNRTWIDLTWVLPEFFPARMDGRVPLDDWLNRFDIEVIARHNAVSDAYATAKLLQIAMARGAQRNADTPASFIEIESARRWMFENR
ncbi:3'-5' exonuclease [Propionivibrio soli]|uniref:3'-5' exonuclease n=1 Tax=Propionivibrio soli TaxID=2976531 RepID=UPI0021E81858|nr:3'-5' exonuclease [Propionivibrio soli]